MMPDDGQPPGSEDEVARLHGEIKAYCETYNVPLKHLLDILEDQKVLPMIRGKATEFLGLECLRHTLPGREWDVQKLNLNVQHGSPDEDIRITHRRTGITLSAETKNAVRGSFRLRARALAVPNFRVKCHRSRSNIKLVGHGNDRYHAADFDLLLCNPSNSLFRAGVVGPGLPLIEDAEALDWLMRFYGVATRDLMAKAAYGDWRLCLPFSIADKDGLVPRTPLVRMEDDPCWFGPDRLAANLVPLVGGLAGG